MQYLAEKDGCGTFLTKDSQLDSFLLKGCNIVRIDEEGKETIVATPEEGFLEERPTLEFPQTMTNTMLMFAGKMGGKE